MIKRTAYATQMTFDVPDSEKRIAEKASELFEELIGLLRSGMDHLHIIYEPFRKQEQLDPQEVLEHRVALRRYRDKIKENYAQIIQKGHKATVLMGEFSIDTRTVEMMNSFMNNIEDVKKQVMRLVSLFSDIGSADFRNGVVTGIEGLKKQTLQLKELISDRILNHIRTNILAKNWIDNVTDEYQNKVYEKTPLIIQLYKERQKAVDST